MASYSGVVLDLEYLKQGIDKSRFLLQFEVDNAGKGQLGRWRQIPGNNRTYWKTVGGNYEVIPDGLVTRNITKYDVHFRDESKLNKTSLKLEDAIFLNAGEFPNINQRGLGYLFETPEYAPTLSPTGTKRGNLSPNVFWAITKKQQPFVDEANMWIGGGLKVSAEGGIKGEAVHGYIVNVKDPSKKHYFQMLTNGVSFGAGVQAGIVVILVNAPNPSVLLNKPAWGFDWSLCLGGAIAKLIKPLVTTKDACNFAKVAELATIIFKNKGILKNDAFGSMSGHLKSIFSGVALESSPGYCVIDTPAAGGLAVGISLASSTITRI